jgi:hypothetical protein
MPNPLSFDPYNQTLEGTMQFIAAVQSAEGSNLATSVLVYGASAASRALGTGQAARGRRR